LVYFVVILVICTKKNLATLEASHRDNRISARKSEVDKKVLTHCERGQRFRPHSWPLESAKNPAVVAVKMHGAALGYQEVTAALWSTL
jgi:hypothetical protein